MKLKQLDYNILNIIKNRFPQINYEMCNNNYKPSNIINSFNNIKYLVFNPIGRKALLWFTYFEDELICILNIYNTNTYYLVENKFNKELVYNNCLIFGYIFIKNNCQIFSVDKILNYNSLYNNINNDNYTKNFENKLNNFSIIFEKYLYNNSDDLLIISLPTIIDNTKIKYLFNKLDNNNKYYIDNIKKLYNIYSVSLFNETKKIGNCTIDNLENILTSNLFNNISNTVSNKVSNTISNKVNNKVSNTVSNTVNKNIINECYFKIKAGLTQDEYFAYIDNNQYYCTLLINSYNMSKFMNSQFRNIKENNNLDLLEESDDEDEFNNETENKFTDLEKEMIFKCKYNKKFKKWAPIDCNNYNKLSNFQNIKYIEKMK